MPMGTIDAVTMAPRTVNAAEIQGKENAQYQNTGEQGAVQFQRETVQQTQQTAETQESETNEYDNSGGSGKGYAGGQSKRKKKDDKKEQKMAPRSDSSFDIMI